MRKYISIIIIVFFFISNLYSQNWIPCNIALNSNSTGGTSVCVHNAKLFAANNNSGLMMSNDYGVSWTVVNSSIISSGVSLFSTNDRLYAVLHNSGCTHIKYSTDNGVSFQLDTIGLPVCYTNATTMPDLLGKAWNNHLLFSLAGPDWEFSRNTANPGWIDASYFDANDCSEFFIKNDTCWAATNGATSNGVAWSVDGLNWTSPVSTGIPTYYVPGQIAWINNRLVMMGADVGAGNAGIDTILKYSDDYGLSFQNKNIKQYLANPSQSTFDMYAAYNHLYLTLENNLYGSAPDLIVSTDGGQTFTSDTLGFPSAINTIFSIKEMAFLNGWAFAQLNSGDLFRKNISSVGISQNNATDYSLTVFPNPAENYLNITSDNIIKQVKIIDIAGKVIAVEKKNTLDVSALETGIYLLNIETSKGIYHRRFVKK